MSLVSRNVLIIAISLTLVSVVISLGYDSHSEVKELVQEQFNEQQLMLAKQAASGIESFINERVIAIEILAEEGSNETPEEMAQSFGTVYNRTDGFFVIEFINESGIVVSGYPEEEVPIGYDLYIENRSQAFDKARDIKRTYITDPVPMFEGGLGLFVWEPIYEDEGFKGVILAIIKLSTITNYFLSPIKSGETGNAYMIDDKGEVIFEKDIGMIGKNYIKFLNTTNMSWTEAMPLIERQINGGEGTGYYYWYNNNNINNISQGGTRHIIAYAPLKSCNQIWSVGVRTPVNEVDRMISSLYIRQMTFIFAVVGIIISWSSYTVVILSRWNKSLEEEVKTKTNDLKQSNEDLGEANKKLREVDQLKSDFISMVSHDLKTPLSAMRISAEMLASSNCDDDTEREMIEIILRNVDRQTILVDDLLDISKIESGKMELNLEEQDIFSIFQASIQNIRQLADEKDLLLNIELPEDLPPIKGDKERLIQVFTNMLDNAIKFTEEGGVTVRAVEMDDQIEIRITDTGIGIPPDELEKIFDKFYQSEGSILKSGSTGLGLAICKGIIEAHNGEIWADSKPGKGSTFIIRLDRW
ncbi:MAG: sensor histidine kinase [Halobacteriota archaeon]|nr:sensor histidine kinase [Halobacteriota archaeon]